MIGLDDVVAAAKRIVRSTTRTPLVPSRTLRGAAGRHAWLKLENLQETGSFKARGACNALSTISDSGRRRGVVCASAGNHAQAMAHYARLFGLDACIVVPRTAAPNKVARTRRFLEGTGRIERWGETLDESYRHALNLAEVEGRELVHAYDDDRVIAGQGTIGLELLEQQPDLKAVFVPIGGGGLAAGIAVAVKERNPRVKVFGVEAAATTCMREAVVMGHPVKVASKRTVADGLAVQQAGERTLEIVQRYLDDILLVDERELGDALVGLIEHDKIVAEGAGAAAVAAVLREGVRKGSGPIAIVVSGGNVDLDVIVRAIQRPSSPTADLAPIPPTHPGVES